MKVENLTSTGEGLLKHSKLSSISINSVPKLIFSKTFSYSDKQSERFLEAIENLYKNPFIQPLLNILAIHIVKNDDLIIMFNASAGHSTLGKYVSNANPFQERISTLPVEDQAMMNKIVSVLLSFNSDPTETSRKIEIQTSLVNEDLQSIICHEFSHLMSDIIFNNYALGYNTLNQKGIFDKCFFNMASKIAQIYNSLFESKIYSSITGREILNIECMRVILSEPTNLKNASQESKIISEKALQLQKFINIFLIPSQEYPDSKAVDYEIFARIFEVYIKYSGKEWTPKFLSEFNPYFEKVLNPAIDKYMQNNIKIVNALNIKPNDVNSFGFTIDNHDAWNLQEKLYFAIVNDDIELSQNLIDQGAEPANELIFGVHKPINVALKRGHNDLVKLMMQKSDNLNLMSKDINGKTTLDIAKSMSDEAYAIFSTLKDSIPADNISDTEVNIDINNELVTPIEIFSDTNSI